MTSNLHIHGAGVSGVYVATPTVFCGCLGIQTQVLLLVQKTLLSIDPSLQSAVGTF